MKIFFQFSAWTKIFGYLDRVTIHTKISLVNKYFFDLVRGSQNLAGELRISTKYLENVFKLNKAGLSLLSYELNSKMTEMLRRWPKVATVKFTQISTFEKHEWLRNFSRTNFERDIFIQFKNLKDIQMAWNTKTLKEVSLSDFMEVPTELNTSEEEPEKILEYHYESWRHDSFKRKILVNKIQYDSINVDKYDAIRDIKMFIPGTETLKFMAKRMKKLEKFQMRFGWDLPFFHGGAWDVAMANELLSKDWQKAFCDFLKSQEDTLMKISFWFPCQFCFRSFIWGGTTGRILDYTKFIYESINKYCPNLKTITINSADCDWFQPIYTRNDWLQQRNEFFPYPMVGAWKNVKIIITDCFCF